MLRRERLAPHLDLVTDVILQILTADELVLSASSVDVRELELVRPVTLGQAAEAYLVTLHSRAASTRRVMAGSPLDHHESGSDSCAGHRPRAARRLVHRAMGQPIARLRGRVRCDDLVGRCG